MIQLKDVHFGAKQQSITHYSICCDNYWYLFIYDSIYYDDLIYNHMIYITHIKLLIIIDYNSSVGLYFYLRVITVFTVFRLLTDFVCLYTYEFSLSFWKIARSPVILLLPLFKCGAEMYIVGSSLRQVKPKTLKLALTTSPLSTQYYAESG
jgi:hypothetical protein